MIGSMEKMGTGFSQCSFIDGCLSPDEKVIAPARRSELMSNTYWQGIAFMSRGNLNDRGKLGQLERLKMFPVVNQDHIA